MTSIDLFGREDGTLIKAVVPDILQFTRVGLNHTRRDFHNEQFWVEVLLFRLPLMGRFFLGYLSGAGVV